MEKRKLPEEMLQGKPKEVVNLKRRGDVDSKENQIWKKSYRG